MITHEGKLIYSVYVGDVARSLRSPLIVIKLIGWKMRVLRIIMLWYCGIIAHADNLESWLEQVQKTTSPSRLPVLPNVKLSSINYTISSPINVFAADRLVNNKDGNFELSQLLMVGYLSYKNKDYAFIQTPLDTRKIMVGDMIGQGNVLQIGKDFVILSEQQNLNGRILNNKIYLRLAVESKI